jgi:transcriptional regulator with XRE-family HTH domain
MGFGERLKRAREWAGLSQAELARRAGLSVRNVQNWEQGHREPMASHLPALAAALGVGVEALLFDGARVELLAAPPEGKPAAKPRGRKTPGRKKGGDR